MSFIKTISPRVATDKLKEIYERLAPDSVSVDNILEVHSLRPHILEGHMALYKAVLHHSDNTLPKWLLESIAVFVSHYNNCAYCVDHHLAGLKRLLSDDQRYDNIACILRKSVNQLNFLEEAFTKKEACALRYAAALTTNPVSIDV